MPLFVRFESVVEERWSKEYGPFEWVQLTYDILRLPQDGLDFAYFTDQGDGYKYWQITDHPREVEGLKKIGVEIDPDDVGKYWSDIIIGPQTKERE